MGFSSRWTDRVLSPERKRASTAFRGLLSLLQSAFREPNHEEGV
jgi:hypothetical protein